jgi:hypothetical protein
VRVPNNGRCRRRYTEDQDNPHLRTDFEPVNDDWDPISEQPSRPCGCDRPRAQGRTDDTTTKCRNVEKIHVGGVIHRCTGVQKFLMAFYVVFGVALGWSLVAFDWPGMVAEWTLSGLGSSPTPELKLGLDRLVSRPHLSEQNLRVDKWSVCRG